MSYKLYDIKDRKKIRNFELCVHRWSYWDENRYLLKKVCSWPNFEKRFGAIDLGESGEGPEGTF